jgi:hypothetical protein
MAIERPSERTGERLRNLLERSIEHQQRGTSFYIDIIYLLTTTTTITGVQMQSGSTGAWYSL